MSNDNPNGEWSIPGHHNERFLSPSLTVKALSMQICYLPSRGLAWCPLGIRHLLLLLVRWNSCVLQDCELNHLYFTCVIPTCQVGHCKSPKKRDWAKIFMTWLREGGTKFHQVSMAVHSPLPQTNNSAKIKFNEQLHLRQVHCVNFCILQQKFSRCPKVWRKLFGSLLFSQVEH